MCSWRVSGDAMDKSYRDAVGRLRMLLKPQTHNDSKTENSEDLLLELLDKEVEYVAQLERERTVCRESLEQVFDRLQELIAENEALQEEQKRLRQYIIEGDLLDGAGKREGLEAELMECRRNLRLTQEELLLVREEEHRSRGSLPIALEIDLQDIENLHRSRKKLEEELIEARERLQNSQSREKEASDKVKASLDLIDDIRREKEETECEKRTLNKEVGHLQGKIRDILLEFPRKLEETRREEREVLNKEMEIFRNELEQEVDKSAEAIFRLESLRRTEASLRRDLEGKDMTFHTVLQETEAKLRGLKSTLALAIMEKEATEEALRCSKIEVERLQENYSQQISFLHMEMNLLRSGLERAESDLGKSHEIVVALEAKAKATVDSEIYEASEGMKAILEAEQRRHEHAFSLLDDVVVAEKRLVDKYRTECRQLSEKLQDINQRNKTERLRLEEENSRLRLLGNAKEAKCLDLEEKLIHYAAAQKEMRERFEQLHHDQEVHSQQVFSYRLKQRRIEEGLRLHKNSEQERLCPQSDPQQK